MLDAGSRLFGSRPFHEVRMEDIATEAAVGKGTIYRYFASKEELYLKLLERSALQYLEQIRAAANRPTGAYSRLVELTKTAITYFTGQPRLLDLIQRAEVERGRGPGFPWHEARLEFFTLVTGLFCQGNERGEFVIADPHLNALLLGGGIRAILLYGPERLSPDLAEQAVQTLVGQVSIKMEKLP
jgi:TetR/AcrR family fatty acid metabolism transcriptional regulator